jgi:hypothetical protein
MNTSQTHRLEKSVAFKWTRIIFRCWKSHTPYDQRIYLAALQKRGSSLHSARRAEDPGLGSGRRS